MVSVFGFPRPGFAQFLSTTTTTATLLSHLRYFPIFVSISLETRRNETKRNEIRVSVGLSNKVDRLNVRNRCNFTRGKPVLIILFHVGNRIIQSGSYTIRECRVFTKLSTTFSKWYLRQTWSRSNCISLVHTKCHFHIFNDELVYLFHIYKNFY